MLFIFREQISKKELYERQKINLKDKMNDVVPYSANRNLGYGSSGGMNSGLRQMGSVMTGHKPRSSGLGATGIGFNRGGL